MPRRALCLWLLIWCSPVSAQDALPPDMLKHLKNATVFITCENNVFQGTGTGFLVRVDGDIGYIVTNHHVVEERDEIGRPQSRPGAPKQKAQPKEDDSEESGSAIVPGGGGSDNFRDSWKISTIFNSGQSSERSFRAKVVAADIAHDLAVLRIEARDLPKPIEYRPAATPVETQTIYTFGYPFGQLFSTTGKNPAVTIGKGTVSSLRMRDEDQVGVVQIDGELNPGNSGGPVVDVTGKLVGVAVAKLRMARIGFAIPPTDVETILSPSVGLWRMSVTDGGKASSLAIDGRLFDPDKKVKSATWHYAVLHDLPNAEKLKKNGVAGLPGSKTANVEIVNGRIQWKTTSPDVNPNRRTIIIGQFIVELASGEKSLSTIKGIVNLPRPPVVAKAPEPNPNPAPRNPTPNPNANIPPPNSPSSPMKRDPWGVLGPMPNATPITATKVNAITNIPTAPNGTKNLIAVRPVIPEPLPCMFWDDNGTTFYLASTNGQLHQFNAADLSCEKAVAFNQTCSWLSKSRDGLLFSAKDRQEVWLLDPKDWSVVKQFPVPKLRRAIGAAAIGLAFAESEDGMLHVLNLMTGQVASRLDPNQFNKGTDVGFNHCVLTPDGTQLIALSGSECLCRFRVLMDGLEYVDSTPRVRQGAHLGIMFSPDNEYVCVPSARGNFAIPNAPEIKQFGTYVFKTSDLTKPALTIQQTSTPGLIAFDPARQRILANDRNNPLTLFSADGQKQKDFARLGGIQPTIPVRQIIISPLDGRVVIMARDRLVAVDVEN